MDECQFYTYYSMPTGTRKRFYTMAKEYDDEGQVGVSPCRLGNTAHPYDKNTGGSGLCQKNSTLPNCVGQAFGRLLEVFNITSIKQRISVGDGGDVANILCKNAFQFFTEKGIYFDRVTNPNALRPGDVVSFKTGTKAHVIFIENVDSTGITFSESGQYNGARQRIGKVASLRTYGGMAFVSAARFRGDMVRKESSASAITQSAENRTVPEQIAGNRNLTGQEIYNNGRRVCWYLSQKGQTLNAICGLLGNLNQESGVNQGRYEVGGKGYGLIQQTPKRYLESGLNRLGLQDGGDSQLEVIEAEIKKIIPGVWLKPKNGYQDADFIHSNKNVDFLTQAYCQSRERPGKPMMEKRISFARAQQTLLYDDYTYQKSGTPPYQEEVTVDFVQTQPYECDMFVPKKRQY